MTTTQDTNNSHDALVEALEEAITQFEQMEKMFRDDTGFMEALAKIRAALKLAKGEA